ncbi:WD40/YVTN/BNR-like repeat-containing protein [Streptomyces sp. NPDC001698]
MRIAGAAALLLGLSLGAPAAPAAQAAAPPAPKGVDPSLYSGLKWRNVGPQLGGRSIAVGGSSARPNEYYFGATGGGLWKTTDGGTGWAPVTDGQISSSSVGAVAVCPADPDVVYIGMGEVDLRGNIIPGDGVYKSTDGGKNWKHLGLADTQMIGRIQVDPDHCDRVFVAAQGHVWGKNTERGVFRSTDGGENWKRVLYVDDQTGAPDLAMDPSDSNVLYAGMWQVQGKFWKMTNGGPGSGLYKSTDGGSTWTELTSRLGLPADAPIGKIGVSVSGADPNRVYALVEAKEGGLFRSDDAGRTWQLVNKNNAIRQRAFYYTRVIADPVDRDRVYAPNVSFMRSNDGGATFSAMGGLPHGDHHALWIDPKNNNRMVEGNDGGGTVTTNGGSSWTAENYSTAQIYSLVTTDNDPYLICGQQQDRGTTCVSSTGGTDMVDITGGSESGPIAVDPSNSNVFYVGSCCGPWTGSMSRFDRSGESAVGSRRIDPWPDNPMGSAAGALKYRFQWSYPLMTNPAEPNAVFAGSQHVMKSTNGGQSWQEISPDLSYADPSTMGDSGGPITLDQTGIEYYATVFSIAPSTLNKNLIWAGTDDGRVWLTQKGGGKWSEVTPPDLEKFTRVSMIDAGHSTKANGQDMAAQKTAYLVGQRYKHQDFTPIAYRTHDSGKHWTKITTGFAPDDYLWSIRQDPVRSGLLYASSAHGVYVSFDDGDHWQSLGLNLPDVTAYDLKVKGNDLVISTQGRGFYVLDDGAELLRRLNPSTTPEDIADFHQTVPPVTPIAKVSPPAAVVPPTTHAGDAETDLAVVHDPNNVVRSVSNNVTVNYTLKKDVTSAKVEFVAADGTVAASNDVPTTAGSRTATWNMRYPDAAGFPGLIYWSGTNQGPKAPLGSYTVRLVVDGKSLQQSFDILKDSRLTHVTEADIAAQFKLDLAVRNATNDANQDVVNIRACTAQVDDRVAAANDADVTQAGTQLNKTLNAVQNELYQTKLQANQDPLNFGIKLNNRIASLHAVIESVDGRPTDQTEQVFEALNTELQAQLKKLRTAVDTDVPNFNQLLASHKLAQINCSAV